MKPDHRPFLDLGLCKDSQIMTLLPLLVQLKSHSPTDPIKEPEEVIRHLRNSYRIHNE